MLRVVLSNSVGGVLDVYDQIETPEEAAKCAIDMIRSAGELHDGDEIQITEE